MCSVSVVVTHWPVEGEFENWIIDLSGGRQAGVFHSHYSTLHILSRRGNSPRRIPPDYAHAVVSKTDDIILSKRFFFFYYYLFISFIYFSTQCYRLKTESQTLLFFVHRKITDTTKNKRTRYSVEWIWKVCRLFARMRSTNYYYFANDFYKRYQLIHEILKLYSRTLSSIILLLKFRLFVVGTTRFIAVKCYKLNYTGLSRNRIGPI